MKIALCTTTIHTPKVLELYKACDSSAKQFVACDQKTADETFPFLQKIGAYEYTSEWKCDKLIGWNTLARRNIAFLEALKWGAELVVSVDDDNAPISTDYFWQYEIKIRRAFNGLVASGKDGWFDAGQLLVPWARHRGIPHGYHHHIYNPITKAKIGVMAGMVLGDSDVDSTTRIERQVDTHSISEIVRSGVVVDLNTHTTFNAQNVAVIRELVPAWFQMPGVGRHDDIFASLVVQRVAKERELHVHFGLPLVHHQRHEHNLIKDLRAEIDGYEFVKPMANLLDQIVLTGKSVIGDTRTIYEKLRHAAWIPEQAVIAAFAWLEDCEGLGL